MSCDLTCSSAQQSCSVGQALHAVRYVMHARYRSLQNVSESNWIVTRLGNNSISMHSKPSVTPNVGAGCWSNVLQHCNTSQQCCNFCNKVQRGTKKASKNAADGQHLISSLYGRALFVFNPPHPCTTHDPSNRNVRLLTPNVSLGPVSLRYSTASHTAQPFKPAVVDGAGFFYPGRAVELFFSCRATV